MYSVDVFFEKVGAHAHDYTDVARLTPLPSANSPLLVFLGVKTDGKTATFLLSSTVSPQGDGKCSPSRRRCHFLDLTAGQRDRLLVLNDNGSVSEYDLRLATVEQTPVASASDAKLAQARASSAGKRTVARASRHPGATSWLAHLGRLSVGAPIDVTTEPLVSPLR